MLQSAMCVAKRNKLDKPGKKLGMIIFTID